jgi:HD-GYP domain-containing protein (c-di-GMP phosphodiesterase class II)
MQIVNDLVKEIALGLVNTVVYFSAHARVRRSIASIHTHLSNLQSEGFEFPLMIGVADEKVIFDRKPLLGAGDYATKLTAAIVDRGCGGLRFEGLASEKEIEFLLDLLGQKPEDRTTVASLNALLEKNEVRNIRFLPPLEESDGPGDHDLWNALDDLRVIRFPVELYQDMVDLLQKSAIRAARNIEIEMDRVYEVAIEVLRILQEQPEMILSIAGYEQTDDYNLRHSVRVCLRTCLVMQTFIDDYDLLLRICCAALLHDIGKSLIPPGILLKAGRLTDEERQEMQQHPIHGARILLSQASPDPLAVRVAYSHHMTVDGNGYPEVPPGEFELDQVTQMLQICDVFEALCSARPYKEAYTPRKAFSIMLGMTGKLNPELLAYFIKTTGLHPMGSIVKLASGAIGQVVRRGKDVHSATVRLLCDEEGNRIPPDERPEVQLDRVDEVQSKHAAKQILRTPNPIEGLLV